MAVWPAVGVGLGWSAFIASHTILSTPSVRSTLIVDLGQDRFKRTYSLVAATCMAGMIFCHVRGKKAPITLYRPGFLAKAVGNTVKMSSMVWLSQAVSTPAPMLQDKGDMQVKGVYRITRHATFASFALLGLGNVLTCGTLSGLLFWAPFPIYFFAGSLHQDERLKDTMPKSYMESTSLVPFQAIWEGRQPGWDVIKDELSFSAMRVAVMAPLLWIL